MLQKYIFYLLLLFAPFTASAQQTEKQQQKENSRNEGFSDFENFIKPYKKKLEEISKQKTKIADLSNFTLEERSAYLKYFLLEKKQKMTLNSRNSLLNNKIKIAVIFKF